MNSSTFLLGILFGLLLALAITTLAVETAPSATAPRTRHTYLTDRVGAKHEIVKPCTIGESE